MHGDGNGDICQHNYVYMLYPTNCANNELRRKEKYLLVKKIHTKLSLGFINCSINKETCQLNILLTSV